MGGLVSGGLVRGGLISGGGACKRVPFKRGSYK